MTGELEGLRMKGARLSVAFEPLAEAGPTGAEAVTLLLTAHPGAPALPLGKGVSGGELSRIVLALEVVLAEARAMTGLVCARPGASAALAERLGRPDDGVAVTLVADRKSVV